MIHFETLNQQFSDDHPQHILEWAAQTYGRKLAVVTSFQPSGIVILHLLQAIAPNVTVLTIDTGVLFPETYALMDEVKQRFNLNLTRVRPMVEPMWEQDVDLCCHMRKVVPLGEALAGYDAWITGLRRDQSSGRAETPFVQWDKKYQNVKIAPLAAWTEDMVWTYLRAHDLPYNVLHDRGYPSIGCLPCTQPVAPDAEDRRAGRWSSSGKTECGIHLPR